MVNKSLRIVYMGTPDFAVAPLEKLLASGCNVVAVVTAPDKPAGRGKKIRLSAVKQFVLNFDQNIPILQPSNLKDPEFVRTLSGLQADLQVVVAFRMLPEVVWRTPRMGTFNLHASLLPQYRGAAPINHAIINGETVTGVTTFMIDEKIDTGNILLQEKTAIGNMETAGDLHDRLMVMGADLVLETVNRLTEGDLDAQTQDSFYGSDGDSQEDSFYGSAGDSQEDSQGDSFEDRQGDRQGDLKNAPKIFKAHCRISWDQPGREVHNLIRGLSPYPAAFTYLEKSAERKILCKVFSSSFEVAAHAESPGTILSDGKKYLKVAVKDGYIQIHSIQQEGKRRMDVYDFLAGLSMFSEPCRFS